MRRKRFILFVFLFIMLWAGQAGCQEIFDLKAINADVEITGYPDGYFFGKEMAVGDINGDGIDDIAAEGSNYSFFPLNLYIIYGRENFRGSIDLETTQPDVEIINLSGSVSDYDYCKPFASFADFNGDQIDDLLIGGHVNYSYLIFGRESLPSVIDLNTYTDMIVFTPTSGLHGTTVGFGDFNQDGHKDIVIGRDIRPEDNYIAEAFVKLWQETLPDTVNFAVTPPDIHIRVSNPLSLTAASVCPADINNDGIADIVFASTMYWASGARNGAVFTIWGESMLPTWINLDSTAADLSLYGDIDYAFLGVGMAGCDFNGDGLQDLAVGAPRNPQSGRTFVLQGDTSLPTTIDLSDTSRFLIIHGYDSTNTGTNIAACDFNQDGYDDLLLGQGEIQLLLSRAHLVYGGNIPSKEISLASSFNGVTFLGELEWDDLGSDVATGDFNGDGLPDLIISASGCDPFYYYKGKIYVIFGDTVIHYGDTNYSKNIDLGDIIFLLNYLFKGDSPPYPKLAGDANCNGIVDIADAIFLLNYLFKGGSAPGCS
jgi:hypothetical protein